MTADPISRRAFVHEAAAAAALAFAPGLAVAADGLGRAKLDAIGIQLYTVRAQMAANVDTTIAAIAEIGYREVEFAGLFGKSAREMRAILDRNHLVAPCSHVSVPPTADEWQRMLEDAATLGQAYIACASIGGRDRSVDGYKRVAAQFNTAGAAAKRAGLQFAYHNHDFEFRPVDGRLPYDILLAECDADLVKMEMDLYWIVTGGQDPLAYFARHPGRFPLVHVKDRATDGAMADVGAGTIDFKAIFAQAGRAGIKHYFVEHDNTKDPLATARASFDYLKRLTF